MDSSNALMKLMEAADLLQMLEELAVPSSSAQSSSAIESGYRITLRNVREAILSSHDLLAGEVMLRTCATGMGEATAAAGQSPHLVDSHHGEARRGSSAHGPTLEQVRQPSTTEGRMAPPQKKTDYRSPIERITGR